ncbi:MAG TPA: carbohydrate ABC transporter substrate-binding protein, partial [Ruminococcus sp.]|nr:carbohydrate ABC transporter substrate-binding protein [Ruminococcus sp.]
MKKKFIALLSAIAVCAAFAGCEKNNDSSSETENSSVENTETSRETTAENSENDEFGSMVNKKCWFGT